MSAVVVAYDLVTAWGWGIEAAWPGLVAGRPAFAPVTRFPTEPFPCRLAALVPGLEPGPGDSLVMQMLRRLFARAGGAIPADALVLLATTTGEVDLLEREVLAGAPATDESGLDRLLARVCGLAGGAAGGRVISSACVSSSAALAQGAAAIRSGEREAVLVVACDAVTEFVFAGFSSLLALDPEGARPFDRRRKGLTVGDAAGYVLLMSEARAGREARARFGEIAGWGLSADANHMTGPSRDGACLAAAIGKALQTAGIAGDRIGSICAHGTGTVYNDSMEMKAFRTAMAGRPVPVYSVKGSVGHTMGAAGLVEAIVALHTLRDGVVPASANLREVDPEAEGWASPVPGAMAAGMSVLSTNSGFGGVNAALVLKR